MDVDTLVRNLLNAPEEEFLQRLNPLVEEIFAGDRMDQVFACNACLFSIKRRAPDSKLIHAITLLEAMAARQKTNPIALEILEMRKRQFEDCTADEISDAVKTRIATAVENIHALGICI